MPQGTIGVLATPADEPLETASKSGHIPAVDVRGTQESLDGPPIQHGKAAAEVADTKTDVTVAENGKILDEPIEGAKTVVTNWIADVQGDGLVVAESVSGDGDFAFPFNLFTAQTGEHVDRVNIELEDVTQAWDDEMLLDTWMTGTDYGDASSIDYHNAADDPRKANIGLGFELRWNGTVAKGVVYESGYVAIWEEWTAAVFCEFIASELLPHAYVPEDDDTEQATL